MVAGSMNKIPKILIKWTISELPQILRCLIN